MRNRYRGPRFVFALLTALVGTASFARADDVVVMPYSCAVVDGKPVLTPADETGHRVLGKLEKQKVKTCSTVDQKRCRQWATFKFDMDCGGSRVPWMQVFANASEYTRRRVWERNGRLRVRNTTQRSKRIDDMCARRLGVNQEWWSVNEICDEVSPLNTPTATDMPAGFAPMVGLDAVFLPESSVTMPAARAAKAAPPPATRVETASIEAAAQAKPAAPAAPVNNTKQQKTAEVVAGGNATREVRPSEAQTVRVDDALRKTEESAPPQPRADIVPPTQEQAAPVVDRTTANSPSLMPADGAVAPAPTVAEQPAADAEKRVAASEVREEPTPVTEASQTLAPQIPAPERAVEPAMVAANEADDAESLLPYLIVALASGLLLATLLAVKWLGRADTSEPLMREPDIAPREVRPAAAAKASTVAPTRIEPVLMPSIPAGTALAVPKRHHIPGSTLRRQAPRAGNGPLTLGENMPSSKDEALELLGMGVASDSNIGSLKKIIDGLRMNWHPDHAQDEADRQVRELRLKQINAAWDILGGKAAGA